MENDIETLATAMYVKIDDMLRDWPDLAPVRPATGTPLTLSDAELLTMAVMSALLGFTSERRWLRYADKELAGMFPRTIGQSGWNKRVRKAFFLFIRVIRMLAMDTSLWSDESGSWIPPRCSAAVPATMRVNRSAVPAPENGTTIRTGRVGQGWVWADASPNPRMHSSGSSAARFIRSDEIMVRNMAPSCHDGGKMGNRQACAAPQRTPSTSVFEKSSSTYSRRQACSFATS